MKVTGDAPRTVRILRILRDEGPLTAHEVHERILDEDPCPLSRVQVQLGQLRTAGAAASDKPRGAARRLLWRFVRWPKPEWRKRDHVAAIRSVIERDGAMTVGEIAEAVDLSKSHVQQLLRRHNFRPVGSTRANPTGPRNQGGPAKLYGLPEA